MRQLVAVMLMVPMIVQAGIYKCKINGEVVYQQSKCPDNAEQHTIKDDLYSEKSSVQDNNDRKRLAELVEKTGDKCLYSQDIAKSIMKMRQNGISMAEVMHIWDDMPNDPKNRIVIASAKKLVEFAYEKPIYATEKYKRREVIEFSNEAYLGCIKARRR